MHKFRTAKTRVFIYGLGDSLILKGHARTLQIISTSPSSSRYCRTHHCTAHHKTNRAPHSSRFSFSHAVRLTGMITSVVEKSPMRSTSNARTGNVHWPVSNSQEFAMMGHVRGSHAHLSSCQRRTLDLATPNIRSLRPTGSGGWYSRRPRWFQVSLERAWCSSWPAYPAWDP